MLLTATTFAQVSTNLPAPNIVVPPPHHLKAVKSKAKTTTAKTTLIHSAKISEPVITVTPGVATIDAENVNYRGQAGLKGESLGQFKKGDTVTIISAISLDKHAADEPAHWAKIALPVNVKVWLNKQFVDAKDKKVTVKKLNLRAGPGENYSVVGTLEKGSAITEISNKGDWIQVAAPADAYAFVAAEYLHQGEMPVVTPANTGSTPVVATTVPAATQIAATPETPVAVSTPVTEPVKIATPPTTEPAASEPVTPAVTTPVKLAEVAPPVVAPVETNLPPRIVTHEGWVRDSVSIVAPTYLELYDPATGKAIDYLYSSTPLLSVARYNGMHIVVTGEEALDARWKDTPVLTIQKIYVLSTNTPAIKK